MKVESLMTRDAECCMPESNLTDAAMIMWRRDCGFVPVVEGGGRFMGVITDRDICMASTIQHRSPDSIPVGSIMSSKVFTCAPSDDLRHAMHKMAEAQVRRLPVVENDGRLRGVLSLNDLALAAERDVRRGEERVSYAEVMGILKAVSEHRLHTAAVS